MSAGIIKEEVQKDFTLFKPASWQAKIDFINHLILYNNVLIAVLAEKKGGKTSFIRLLQENFDSKIAACVHKAQIDFDENALVAQLVSELHLKEEVENFISLASVIQQINARKIFVILIIDNAQNLPESWIKAVLYELRQQKEPSYFRLCLVSDFSLVINYNALVKQDNQNTVHCIELGTLNENETKTYLLHKNLSQNKIYTDEQLSHIYKMTGGCLAKINQHLSNNLLAFSNSPRLTFKNSCIAIIVAISVAGFSLKILMAKEAAETVNLEKIAVIAPVKEKNIHLSSQMPNWRIGQESIDSEIPAAPFALVKANDLPNEINGLTDTEETFIPSIGLAKKIKFPENKAESFMVSFNKITKKAKHTANSDYTVQLVASHDLNEIHNYIRQNKLDGKSVIRLVNQNNKAWYILTLGNYKTSAEAKTVLQSLSKDLTVQKPWVRITKNLKLIS